MCVSGACVCVCALGKETRDIAEAARAHMKRYAFGDSPLLLPPPSHSAYTHFYMGVPLAAVRIFVILIALSSLFAVCMCMHVLSALRIVPSRPVRVVLLRSSFPFLLLYFFLDLISHRRSHVLLVTCFRCMCAYQLG